MFFYFSKIRNMMNKWPKNRHGFPTLTIFWHRNFPCLFFTLAGRSRNTVHCCMWSSWWWSHACRDPHIPSLRKRWCYQSASIRVLDLKKQTCPDPWDFMDFRCVSFGVKIIFWGVAGDFLSANNLRCIINLIKSCEKNTTLKSGLLDMSPLTWNYLIKLWTSSIKNANKKVCYRTWPPLKLAFSPLKIPTIGKIIHFPSLDSA